MDPGEADGAVMDIPLTSTEVVEGVTMEAGGVAMIMSLMATPIILIRTVAHRILTATPTLSSDTAMEVTAIMGVTVTMEEVITGVTAITVAADTVVADTAVVAMVEAGMVGVTNVSAI